MADNKKYYYLKLKDNFFDSDEMIILESMPDGFLYSNILLKLYLRSLKNDGKLMFNNKIPFNSTMLAQVTRMNVGVIEKAVDIFKELGLIEILDNGAIFMTEIQNFIGNSSTEADRKRLYRNKIENEKGQISDKCPDKNPPELELELELEKDIEIKKEKSKYPLFDKLIEKEKHYNQFDVFIKDFIDYRKTIKKTLKTTNPLVTYVNVLTELNNLGYNIKECIETMKSNEWQTLKVEYIHKPQSQKPKQIKTTVPSELIGETFLYDGINITFNKDGYWNGKWNVTKFEDVECAIKSYNEKCSNGLNLDMSNIRINK